MRVGARPTPASAGAASTATPRRVARSMARPARGLRRLIEASLNGCARTATHRRPALAPPARAPSRVGRRPRARSPASPGARDGRPRRARPRPPPAARARLARAHTAASSSSGETLVCAWNLPAKAVSRAEVPRRRPRRAASYGHVRDLVEKSGSVSPSAAWRAGLGGARARDGEAGQARCAVRRHRRARHRPRPKGEAISWHILELLPRAKAS